jgi:hypothetical protein
MTRKDAFAVGHFGFFRDADLTMKLSDENLYDQIGANGWIELWFGGSDLWLPDSGTYAVHVTTPTTFFWDIVDENGKRTKTGFSAIQVPYNINMESHYGDIIPENPDEVFDYTISNPAQDVVPLICSNLWFYTNYFSDQYYRYNLLVLNVNQPPWPNEIDVDIRPMNDNLKLYPGEYIVGYRPKIEYMNQLAVVKTIKSGDDGKILFRLKVDLNFLSENPTAKRYLRVFTPSWDKVEVLLFPRSPNDILWHKNRRFVNEYFRYILYNGIMQYLPPNNLLDRAEEVYREFMEASNYILKLDSSNMRLVARDIDRILVGEKIKLVGYSALIAPYFLKWVNQHLVDKVYYDQWDILYHIVLTTQYYKGFDRLDDYMGNMVGNIDKNTGLPAVWDGDIEIVDGQYVIANGGEIQKIPEWAIEEPIKIVTKDGVKQYEDGYVPTSAKEYLNPKPGYLYEGDTGSGIYKIMVAERPVDVFCDMESDGGGWMYLIVSHATEIDYIKQLGDTYSIEQTLYRSEDYGVGWGDNTGNWYGIQFYNMPFTEISVYLSGEYDNPEEGTGYLEMITGASGVVVSFKDENTDAESGQTLIVDGTEIFRNQKENLVKYKVVSHQNNTGGVNNLVVRMRGDEDVPYTKRYIYMLAVR